MFYNVLPWRPAAFIKEQDMNEEDALLNATQAAAYLGVARNTFWRWQRDGLVGEPKRYAGYRRKLYRLGDLKQAAEIVLRPSCAALR